MCILEVVGGTETQIEKINQFILILTSFYTI
jgi:hypothetical protein